MKNLLARIKRFIAKHQRYKTITLDDGRQITLSKDEVKAIYIQEMRDRQKRKALAEAKEVNKKLLKSGKKFKLGSYSR